MYKNTITSDNTPDSHKAVIVGQIDGQLAQIADDENIEAIKVLPQPRPQTHMEKFRFIIPFSVAS